MVYIKIIIFDKIPFKQVKGFGFKDSWREVGCPPPVKTCRFDTHIDYVYVNNKLLSYYKVENVVHVEDKASDHNLVKATFIRKSDEMIS